MTARPSHSIEGGGRRFDSSAPLPLAGGVGGGTDVEEAQRRSIPSPSPSRKRKGNAGVTVRTHLKGPRTPGQLSS